MTDAPGYDLFLSHATPDKPWVRTLTRELEALDLRVFLDELEIPPGRNWVQALEEALAKSRFLVLVLSPRTVGRAWVTQEWTAFMARHGPLGRIVPVMLETVAVPPILGSIQYLNDQDAERVARELATIVGRPGELHDQDTRRLLLGQHLSFVLELTDEGLRVNGPDGRRREVVPPWQGEDDARFTAARPPLRLALRPTTPVPAAAVSRIWATGSPRVVWAMDSPPGGGRSSRSRTSAGTSSGSATVRPG